MFLKHLLCALMTYSEALHAFNCHPHFTDEQTEVLGCEGGLAATPTQPASRTVRSPPSSLLSRPHWEGDGVGAFHFKAFLTGGRLVFYCYVTSCQKLSSSVQPHL